MMRTERPDGRPMKKIEYYFELILWNSRLAVIAAVIASLFTSLAVYYMTTVDAVILISDIGEYASPALSEEERLTLRANTIRHVIGVVDGYLLGTVLLIFALGLYELFVSRIDPATRSETAPRVLVITSLDDLKVRLAKVMLMILIVRFFEHALDMKFSANTDMLYFAGSIALIGLALFLTHASEGSYAPLRHRKKESPAGEQEKS